MTEFNEQDKATAEVYEQEVTRLTAERDNLQAHLNATREYLNRAETKLSHLTSIVQDEFDKGGWDEDDEFFKAICQYLDIETEEEVEVLVKAEWVVTLKVRKGTDLNLGDICVDVDDPTIDTYASGVEVENIGYVETSVDEY